MNICSQQAQSWRVRNVLTALLLMASVSVSNGATATDISLVAPTSITINHATTFTFTLADLTASTTRFWAFIKADDTCANNDLTASGVAANVYSSSWTQLTDATFAGGGTETVSFTAPAAGSGNVGADVMDLCIADDAAGLNGVTVTAASANDIGVVAATANNVITAFSFTPDPATTADTVTYTITAGATSTLTFQTSCVNSATGDALSSGANTVNKQISNAALYQVCATADGGSDAVQQVVSSVALTVNIGPILVFGDPVAYYGDKRQLNFWLPLGMMMPLLRTPDLDIFGSTYQGLVGKKGQYFNRFVVASEGGLMVDVKVRKSSLSADAPPDPSVALQPTDTFEDLKTMDVDFVEGVMRGTVGHDDGWTQVQALTGQKGSELPSEAIEVVAKSLHFTLNSCFLIHTKFGGFAPQYSHMSLQVVAMPNAHENYTGIFPELWGMQPMSKCTEELTNMEGEPHSLPNECYKWEAYEKHRGMQLADSEQLPSVEL